MHRSTRYCEAQAGFDGPYVLANLATRAEAERHNPLHKLDMLIAALRVFCAGVEAEYERWERELAEQKGE